MNEELTKLLKSETGTEVVRETLQAAPRQVSEAKDVWNAVREFAGEQGWLCLTDEVLVVKGPADLEKGQGRVILSGELVKGGQSLHIHQTQDGWLLIDLSAGAGQECLKLRESFISTEDKQGLRLNYDVYWSLQQGVYAPYAFRFVGFSEGGSNS